MTGFTVRHYRHTDENFVVQTWLDSFSHSHYGRMFGARDGKLWDTFDRIWTEHRRIVTALIVEANIDVVCDDDDENLIFGWACTEPGILHYAVVKRTAIDDGFGREMIGLLLGDRMKEPTLMSHEPAWTRHTGTTRRAYEAQYPDWMRLVEEERRRTKNPKAKGPRAPTTLVTDYGAPLPYYHQESEAWFPIPRSWKYDEHLLSRKWCPVRKEKEAA